jgi:hypothetical protein
MSGFLGVLNTPVPATHLEKCHAASMSTRVASVVLKMEALTELIVTTPNGIPSEGGENTQ